MTTLEGVLLARIETQGPIRFDDYMRAALYDPEHGYYTAGADRTGWTGHFVTAPELDPMFGALWAEAFDLVWAACGRPARFRVVEVGPGRGSFAAGVLEAAPRPLRAALSWTLVEPSATAAARQRRRLAAERGVRWADRLEAAGDGDCLFANEVLDNLPVRLVERRSGRLEEVWVGAGDQGLAARLRPASPEVVRFLSALDVEIPEGHRFEVGLGAARFAAVAARAVRRGAVFFVDYGDDAAGLAVRPRGTLVCYSDKGADEDVLERPGGKDITAHVNWTAVARALRGGGHAVVGPVPQRAVLRALGLDALHEQLRAEHRAALAAGDGASAVASLSRRQALGALSDPGGLGSLGVLSGVAGIGVPAFLRAPARGPAPGPALGEA